MKITTLDGKTPDIAEENIQKVKDSYSQKLLQRVKLTLKS